MSALLDAALSYADRGWAVFPLHSMVNGRCSCGKTCSSPGKHPRTAKGFQDATTDEATVREWWSRWPNANIGIATGHVSDLFVMDVDPRHGGNESLKALQVQHGELPSTVEVVTGSGGAHLYFMVPAQKVSSSAGKLGPGLDIRCDGGYVVAPPSNHHSGGTYEWEASHHPDDVPMMIVPDWLIDLILKPAPVPTVEAPTPTSKIPIGREALDFVANGAPMGEQRNRAVRAARNYLSSGATVEATADALWRGFQASPQEQGRPWTYDDANKIAQDLALKPAPPLPAIASAHRESNGNGTYHAPPAGEDAPPQAESQPIGNGSLWDAAPAFPDAAWHPVHATFRDWIIEATEAPVEYMWAAAHIIIGAVIGRRAFVRMGRKLYANSFLCEIGAPGVHKGTPISLAMDELGGDLAHLMPSMSVIRGTGSAEGLLEAFMQEVEEESDGKRGRPAKTLAPVPRKVVIGIEEEFGAFLHKAHATGTANLREIAIQLWDGANYSPPTRNRKLRVEEPFYTLLTMTTPETMEARLEADDINSGLLPRTLFIYGHPRKPIAWPDAPPVSGQKAFMDALTIISREAATVSTKNGGEIKPSITAKAAWQDVYELMQKSVIHAASPEEAAMLQRMPAHALKLALVYCLCGGRATIEQMDIDRAIETIKYFAKTARFAAKSQVGSDMRRVEQKIRLILAEARAQGDGWVKPREIQRRLSGMVNADQFHRSLKALIQLDAVESLSGSSERPGLIRAAL